MCIDVDVRGWRSGLTILGFACFCVRRSVCACPFASFVRGRREGVSVHVEMEDRDRQSTEPKPVQWNARKRVTNSGGRLTLCGIFGEEDEI